MIVVEEKEAFELSLEIDEENDQQGLETVPVPKNYGDFR